MLRLSEVAGYAYRKPDTPSPFFRIPPLPPTSTTAPYPHLLPSLVCCFFAAICKIASSKVIYSFVGSVTHWARLRPGELHKTLNRKGMSSCAVLTLVVSWILVYLVWKKRVLPSTGQLVCLALQATPRTHSRTHSPTYSPAHSLRHNPQPSTLNPAPMILNFKP